MAAYKKIPKQPHSSHKAPKTRSRGQKRLRAAAWLLCLTVFFVAATFLVNYLYGQRLITLAAGKETDRPTQSTDAAENASFRLRSIEVEGNTHYSAEQILHVSGLYTGQSIWEVNKAQVVANIKASCPYVESVQVSTSLLTNVTIEVKETSIAGAMYANGKWLLVGRNGQALDTLEMTGNLPPRYLYFKGATPTGKGLGKPAMEAREITIMQTLLDAFEAHELTGIAEIDMSDKTNIKLNWNNQITIALGNDSNLTYEIAVVKETVPKVLKNHGTQARGVLDVSGYAYEDRINQVVFTPEN